jgi:segregation and condensation protein B
MFGTTKEFLDYFGLRKLEELPTLAELRDIDSINVELDFSAPSDQEEGPDPEIDHATVELSDTDGGLRVVETDERPVEIGLEAEANVEDPENTENQELPA